MLIYRFLKHVAAYMPHPPAFTTEQIAGQLDADHEELEQVIRDCLDRGFIDLFKARIKMLPEGYRVLAEAKRIRHITNAKDIHQHRLECLTGITEKTSKKSKLKVTRKSKITTGVLSTTSKRRSSGKHGLEDTVDMISEAKKIAKKKGQTVEEVIDELMNQEAKDE